jgi:hypothetical protein
MGAGALFLRNVSCHHPSTLAGHVLQEWLEHYVWQGARVIVLLDNNSTVPFDATPPPWAPASVVVDVHAAPLKHSQEMYYNTIGAPALAAHGVDVVLVVDMDEFLFSVDGRPLSDVFASAFAEPSASRVCTNWTLFGSSHHVKQPPSVRLSFTWRGEKPRPVVKCAARVRDVAKYLIHGMELRTGHETLAPALQLNHYPLQSREFFMAVKATRGDAVHASSEHVRGEAYFKKYNAVSSDVQDFTLARQVLQYYHRNDRSGLDATPS